MAGLECPFCGAIDPSDYEIFRLWPKDAVSALEPQARVAIGCLVSMVNLTDKVGLDYLRKRMRQLIDHGKKAA